MRHPLDAVESALVDASNALFDVADGYDSDNVARQLILLDLDSAIDRALRLVQSRIERDRHELEQADQSTALQTQLQEQKACVQTLVNGMNRWKEAWDGLEQRFNADEALVASLQAQLARLSSPIHETDATMEQLQEQRFEANKAVIVENESYHRWRERAETAEAKVTVLQQQLKETEGRLAIVEVNDGKVNGIRITPARDLEYERRVRAEANLTTSQAENVRLQEELANLDKTARELLDNARAKLAACAALPRYGYDAAPARKPWVLWADLQAVLQADSGRGAAGAMTWARRVDAPHHDIMQGLRDAGCLVRDTSRLPGWVDLTVYTPHHALFLLEVKASPTSKRTVSQKALAAFGWPIHFVCSIDEALKVCEIIRMESSDDA